MAVGRPRLGFSVTEETRPSRSSMARWRRSPTELSWSSSASWGADSRPWRRRSTTIRSLVPPARSDVMTLPLLPVDFGNIYVSLASLRRLPWGEQPCDAGVGDERHVEVVRMAEGLFRGVGVALATLFDDEGEVDAKATADFAATLVDL